MKLKDHHCVELSIKSGIPYDKGSWSRIVRVFDGKEGAVRRKNSEPVAVRSQLLSSDRKADYHFHFFASRSTEKGGKNIELHISLHPHSSSFVRKIQHKTLKIADLELWLSSLLGKKFEERGLSLDLKTVFVFKRPSFDSVLPVPFQSPFEIPGKNILGKVSISGLKLRLEDSGVGLKTIYFEPFPKFIGITALFSQKMVLNTGQIEKFLENASKIAILFVKKEKQNNVRKKV